MHEQRFRLSEIADALRVRLARLKTLRARGQLGTLDTGLEDGTEYLAGGQGWHSYSLLDAVAMACVLDLMKRGLNADVAGNVVFNCRQFIAAHHPDSPSMADVWLGVVGFNEGAGHVGGHLAKVLASIEDQVSRNIRDTKNGGGSAVFLVNASNHYRKLEKVLRDV